MIYFRTLKVKTIYNFICLVSSVLCPLCHSIMCREEEFEAVYKAAVPRKHINIKMLV